MRKSPAALLWPLYRPFSRLVFPGPAATQIFAGEAERSTETIFVFRGNNQLGKKCPSG
jgi:hypothetical protein